ncbi:MAG: hypothetical protein PHE73_09175 [Sulfurovaceae bacterium]|nr:hypothetical protein [Sulfurovaceae bacterium]
MNEKIYCIGCNRQTLRKTNTEYICENPFCLRYKLVSVDYNNYKQMKLAEMGMGESLRKEINKKL